MYAVELGRRDRACERVPRQRSLRRELGVLAAADRLAEHDHRDRRQRRREAGRHGDAIVHLRPVDVVRTRSAGADPETEDPDEGSHRSTPKPHM
jgi:hypothetical protein